MSIPLQQEMAHGFEPVPGSTSSVTIHKTSVTKPNYDQGAIDRLMRELEDDFGLKRPH